MSMFHINTEFAITFYAHPSTQKHDHTAHLTPNSVNLTLGEAMVSLQAKIQVERSELGGGTPLRFD